MACIVFSRIRTAARPAFKVSSLSLLCHPFVAGAPCSVFEGGEFSLKFLLTSRSLLWYITPVKKCASPSARLPLQLKSFHSGDFHVHEMRRSSFYAHSRKRLPCRHQ